jgi:putative ABC transport system permease protein
MKSALTVLGIALAAAVLVVGGFMWGAIDFMLDVQFGQAHRADLTVTFSEITGRRAVHALQALPGVRRVEPFRAAPVRLRAGHRQERLGLQGLVADAQLHRTLDDRFAPIRIEGGDLLLTDHLATALGLRAEQTVQVELLEGRRTTRALTVGGRVGELVGQNAYMNFDALNAWLGDGDVVSGAFLQVDADALDAVYARLKDMPRVVGVMNGKVARKSFLDSMGENLLIFAFINLCLAATIAVGVVYNSMRTTLSERANELASLRVLGYTRTEAGYVLLGEIVALTLIAIPVGQAIGYVFCAMLAESLASDLYRVPVALTPRTYAHAAVVVLAATLLSSLVMVRHIRRLSLVSALKVPQ